MSFFFSSPFHSHSLLRIYHIAITVPKFYTLENTLFTHHSHGVVLFSIAFFSSTFPVLRSYLSLRYHMHLPIGLANLSFRTCEKVMQRGAVQYVHIIISFTQHLITQDVNRSTDEKSVDVGRKELY